MLDVRKLKALREVALRESFSEAAERLGYTQSAISQQISQLERQVGTLLIDRRGRGVKLTPAGRTLVECADVILRRLHEAESELEAITGIRHGSLRLAAFGESTVTWMPTAIRRFRTRHPGVLVAVSLSEPVAAAALVDGGEAEIAVLSMSGDVKDTRLSGSVAAVHLLDDPVRVALPADHRLAGRLSIGLAELAEDPWILPTRTSAVGEVFTDLCAQSGLKPRVAVRLDDCLTVHGMVAAGLGVALVPAMAAALSLRSDVVVRPLHSPEPAQSIVAVVRSGIERSPTVAAMLGELQNAATEWRSLHPVLSRGITAADRLITNASRP